MDFDDENTERFINTGSKKADPLASILPLCCTGRSSNELFVREGKKGCRYSLKFVIFIRRKYANCNILYPFIISYDTAATTTHFVAFHYVKSFYLVVIVVFSYNVSCIKTFWK